MKIPFYDSFIKSQDARDRMFLIYINISLVAILAFSAIFAWLGYTIAAISQIIGCVPFFIALALYEKEFAMIAKVTAFLTSIILVVLQTNFIFSAGTGFHFQLFALLVVLYLINDLKESSQRRFVASMTALIILSFFFCQNYNSTTPIISLNQDLIGLFYNVSLSVTFLALNILLYLYALQLSKKETELHYLAQNDALTGIMNRGSFTTQGDLLFKKMKSEHLNMSVILFDIDNFKRINDTYGHPIGDLVLKELAKDIKSLLRKTDLFARYGGEEFTILLPMTSKADAYHLAEKIRKHLETRVLMADQNEVQFTISLGVASLQSDHDSFDDLLLHSDQARYASKHAGKNKTTLYGAVSI